MSHFYKAILWNKNKKLYDKLLLYFILGFLILFVAFNLIAHPTITPETLIIRAFGILAIVLLHIILSIGPLCRINPNLNFLLYNRRHLGVTMFLIAAVHGIFSIVQFHSFGNENPLVSVFTANTAYNSWLDFPFQTLGFFALLILFMMAATSHDFWLKNLGPKMWKSLHMMVYLAYVLLVLHIMLGAVQNERSPFITGMVLLGVLIIGSLHVYAGNISKNENKTSSTWLAVAKVEDIPLNRAKTVMVNGEKVAIFNHDGKLSAVSNYCRHQGGPIGEGKIIDGCITCPWHGYQYQPEDGCSPPPFDEKLETYFLKLEGNQVFIDPKPNPEGTRVEPINSKV